MYRGSFRERRELEQLGDSILDTVRAGVFMPFDRKEAERMIELNYDLYPEIKMVVVVMPFFVQKPWYEVTDKMLNDTLMAQCIMLMGKFCCLASRNSHLLDCRYWRRMTLREIFNYAKEYLCQKGYFPRNNTMGGYSSCYQMY